jgi:hypothetical protein
MVWESESKGTHVKIEVKCKGLDLSNLSLKENIVAGRILEDSYNTIHEGAGDDSVLCGVTYRGAGGVAGTGRDENNMDRRKGADMYMEYKGDYDCGPLCLNDDDEALTLFLGSQVGPLFVRGRLSFLAVFWEAVVRFSVVSSSVIS